MLPDVVELPYSKTVRVPVTVVFPTTGQSRQKMQMVLRLKRERKVISETSDPVEVFSNERRAQVSRRCCNSSEAGASLDY